MGTSELNDQQTQAKNAAVNFMNTNNSPESDLSDKILSILEAGAGSSIVRNQLDQYLHNYVMQHI